MQRSSAMVAAVAAAALGLTACSSSGAPARHDSSGTAPAASGSITVFAASSLTGTFTALGAAFEKAHPGTKIVFNFGSSGALSTQITQGAPADVFASAAPKNMQTVVSAGDAPSSTVFVRNTAEIAVAPGNPKGIAGLSGLSGSGIKVALCVVTAPCGALASMLLTAAKVTVTPTASEPDVKSTLAVVESGEVDAGIVYVTDVKAAGAKVTGVTIPAAQNGTTDYPIAALTHAADPALAKAFVAYVESADGLAVLERAGFQAP